MQIVHKKVVDLTGAEYRAMLKANFGPDEGYMYNELKACRNRERRGETISLWIDGSSRRLIGWALLVPVRTNGDTRGTWWTKRHAKYTVQFWVKSQYRKKGYGKILMNEVKKYDARPHVFPHDDASGNFFSSYNVTIMRVDNEWMIPGKPRVA